MKARRQNPFLHHVRGACAVSVTALAIQQGTAASIYWDINGNTAGAGSATPAGDWDNATWSTAPDGDATTENWLPGTEVAVFSAGADATGAFTVNLETEQFVGGVTVEEGTPTISGTGSLSLTAASAPFTIAGTATISAGISGEGSGIDKRGPGELILGGTGAFDGEIVIDGGTLTLGGTIPFVPKISFQWDDSAPFQNLNIVAGANITTGQLVLSDLYYSENTVSHSGGTLNVVGTNDSNTTSASLLLGHWGYGSTSVYGLSGGTLNSLGARLSLGWDRSNVQFNQSGGTANLLGINLNNSKSNPAAYNLTGGRLNLGSGGINNQANKSVNLGTATLGAFGNWTSTKPLSLTGGTLTVDTLDSADGVSERTISLAGGISETAVSNLTVTGTGTLSLGGTLAYSGNTVVNGGTLLPGPTLTNSTLMVNAGGSLGGGTAATPGVSTVGTILLNGGRLAFRVGSQFDQLIAATVNVQTPSTIAVLPAQALNINDEFTVLKYTSLTGLGYAGLSAALPNPHYNAMLVNDSGNSQIKLIVTGSDALVWTGAGGATWNVNTTSNWKLTSALPSTVASKFYDFDVVTFDDSSAIGNVVLSGVLKPAEVTVSSESTNYTFSGGSIGGGASLFKSGAATLSLPGANTFTGLVDISGGRVVIGTGTSLGTGSTPVTFGSGSVLQSTATFSTSRGHQVIGGSAEIETDAGTTWTMATAVTGGGTLTKSGTGTLRFTTYTGGSFNNTSIAVTEGTLLMSGGAFNANIGLPAITVEDGAQLVIPPGSFHALGGAFTPSPTLTLNGGTFAIGQEQYLDNINMTGGAIVANGGNPQVRADNAFNLHTFPSADPSVLSGLLLLRVNSNFAFNVEDGAAAQDLLLENVTIDTAANPITKTGAGVMAMTGTYAYTSNTVVNGGTLLLTDNSQLKFVIGANGVSNKLTGTGAVQIEGDFNLDLTGAVIAPGNSWTLVDTSAKAFSSSFTIVGFTESAGVHTGPNGLTFSEATGVLSVGGGSGGYSAYEAANNITGAGANADSDGDGVSNGLEFVLGGISDPALNSRSLALLPTITDLGATIRFRFHLTDAAAAVDPDVWSVEFDDDLAGSWTTAVDPGNATIIITPDGSGPSGAWSRVDVTLPKSGAKRFVRLRTTL